MKIVAASDLRNNLSDYLNMVRYQQISLQIKKGTRIIAKIVPLEEPALGKQKRKTATEMLYEIKKRNPRFMEGAPTNLSKKVDALVYE